MGQVITIGLDLDKSGFQVHGVDAASEVLVRRQIRRAQLLQFFAWQASCLVGMEACASAHHWGRELVALGHGVKLMPAQYVKPHVKRGKNDAAAQDLQEARPAARLQAHRHPIAPEAFAFLCSCQRLSSARPSNRARVELQHMRLRRHVGGEKQLRDGPAHDLRGARTENALRAWTPGGISPSSSSIMMAYSRA